MSYGWPRHPDEDSSGFHPSLGWCAECDAVIRLWATRWYGSTSQTHGPYCSSECLSRAWERGSVDTHPRDIGHTPGDGWPDEVGLSLGDGAVGSLPLVEPATVRLSPPLTWTEGRNDADREGGPRLFVQSSDPRVVDALLPL